MRIVNLIITATCLWGAGCRSAVDSLYPRPFEVTCISGGGFSGMWHGYQIRDGGYVFQLSGLPAAFDTTNIGSPTDGVLQQYWEDAERIGFFKADQEEAANMTSLLRIHADTFHNEMIWPRGLTPTPDSIEYLYEECIRIAQSVIEGEAED